MEGATGSGAALATKKKVARASRRRPTSEMMAAAMAEARGKPKGRRAGDPLKTETATGAAPNDDIDPARPANKLCRRKTAVMAQPVV